MLELNYMGYEIKDNEDIPQRGGFKYPFADMSPGNSIDIVGEADFQRALAAAHVYASRHPGIKMSGRRTKTGGSIWRLK